MTISHNSAILLSIIVYYPILGFLTNKRLDNITIKDNEIISLIRKINPNKATGSDGISGQMLLLCDESVILPLQIMFTNILTTSIYPSIWKVANVTPVFKKGDKQLIKNYRPISLLPICGKILEKIIFNNLYSYLHTNNLLTKNQSGFRPGDSTTNQLLYLLDEIHQAFDITKSFEVRAVFLDISKAFDKVWHISYHIMYYSLNFTVGILVYSKVQSQKRIKNT